jgi:L,D-transpeptidase ErfK/SrfK
MYKSHKSSMPQQKLLAQVTANILPVLACLWLFTPTPASATTYDIDGDVVGEVTKYKTKEDDTLYDVARRFDLGIVEVLAANPGVDVWDPGEGTELKLPTAHILPPGMPHKGIIINLSELRLFYFPNPHTVMTFPIGIGMEGWQTPVGVTHITTKRKNPTWIPPDSIRKENPDLPKIVLPGPDNPLGQYALNLGLPGERIHGTNRPQGIGRRSSHGCIRLYPEDIAALFAKVKVGTPVSVIDEPFRVGWEQDTLYLEVTPTQEQSDKIAEYETPPPPSLSGTYDAVDKALGDTVTDVDWYAVDNAVREQNGLPVAIARRDESTEDGKTKSGFKLKPLNF